MCYEQNGVVQPRCMAFVLTNSTKKSTSKSKENPVISRKAEKNVNVSHNWSSSVLMRDTQRASNLVEREKQRLFRVSKYLCNMISRKLCEKSTVMMTPISVERRVAITVWRLATNIDYRSIGHLFGFARCTACGIVNEVCTVIVQQLFK